MFQFYKPVGVRVSSEWVRIAMKKLVSVLCAVIFPMLLHADSLESLERESLESSDGTQPAIDWLEEVDAGKYEQSWNRAAPFFQSQVTVLQWVDALNQTRKPLGSVVTRKIYRTDLRASLPGVPEGEYVVITLLTDFENKKSAIETITVTEVNREWRVMGYFIK